MGGRCHDGVVAPTSEEFQEAWPRIVRALAAWTGSLDDAEEYAAEAVSRAVTHHDVDDLAAWCVSVAKRAWIDDHRRRDVFTRRMPELAPDESTAAMHEHDLPEGLDDRLALLFVACDDALGPRRVDGPRTARGVRPERRGDRHAPGHRRHHRGRPADARQEGTRRRPGRVPGADGRGPRRPVAGGPRLRGRHVHGGPPGRVRPARRARGHRQPGALDRRRAGGDLPGGHRGARPARGHPARPGPETRPGRRPRCRAHAGRDGPVALGPAPAAGRSRRRDVRRRRGREVRAGVRDLRPAHASPRPSRTPTGHGSRTSTSRSSSRWPSPAVHVALLVARGRVSASADELAAIERELDRVAADGPSFARRDALFALADLRWRPAARTRRPCCTPSSWRP